MRKAAWIITAGIATRLLLLLVVDPSTQILGGDSAYYAAGELGYRAPLYSLVASRLTPLGWEWVVVLQCALTIGSGVAAAKVIKGRAGVICGTLIATCPFLALYDFRLLSESLYINLLWLGFLALYAQKSIASGLLIGLAMLTRDTLLLLPLFLWVMAMMLRLAGRITISRQGSAAAMVIAYTMLIPWVMFNGSISKDRAGLNLWVGTWELNTDWYLTGVATPQLPDYAFRSADERRYVKDNYTNDTALRLLAIKRMNADPAGTALTWARRYPNLWLGTRSDHLDFRAKRGSLVWTALKASFYSLNLTFLAFGLWGLLKPKWLFAVPVIYAGLVYVPFHAEARYTLFAFPFLIALGSRRLASRIDERKTRASPC